MDSRTGGVCDGTHGTPEDIPCVPMGPQDRMDSRTGGSGGTHGIPEDIPCLPMGPRDRMDSSGCVHGSPQDVLGSFVGHMRQTGMRWTVGLGGL